MTDRATALAATFLADLPPAPSAGAAHRDAVAAVARDVLTVE